MVSKYNSYRVKSKEENVSRFMEKVTKTDSCWNINQNNVRVDGKPTYGSFSLAGKQMKSNRVSYLLFVGEIPKGKCVLHHCDNERCVNPKHLYLGTRKDNMRDMADRGRCHFQLVSYGL